MRRIGAVLGLLAALAVTLKTVAYFDLLDADSFLIFVVPPIVVFVICRYFGLWPFSG